jgi:hypothetical protein
MKVRAMDNQLHLAVARNEGVGTGIFAPDGTCLEIDGGDRGLVWADIDLARPPRNWTGSTMRDTMWSVRREETYGLLCGSLQPHAAPGGSD